MRPQDQPLIDSTLKRIERPEVPGAVKYLWEWFLDMHGERQSSGYGPQPLTSIAILAWASLYRIRLTPWEVRMLKALDRTWLDVWAEARGVEEQNRAKEEKAAASAPPQRPESQIVGIGGR